MEFRHSIVKHRTDYEDGRDFTYRVSETMTTTMEADKFRICNTHSNQLQGTVRAHIELSVDEAKKLKEELERFINKNI